VAAKKQLALIMARKNSAQLSRYVYKQNGLSIGADPV